MRSPVVARWQRLAALCTCSPAHNGEGGRGINSGESGEEGFSRRAGNLGFRRVQTQQEGGRQIDWKRKPKRLQEEAEATARGSRSNYKRKPKRLQEEAKAFLQEEAEAIALRRVGRGRSGGLDAFGNALHLDNYRECDRRFA
ncbi:unnamed protein product [Calypogeia fissa]